MEKYVYIIGNYNLNITYFLNQFRTPQNHYKTVKSPDKSAFSEHPPISNIPSRNAQKTSIFQPNLELSKKF